MCGIVGYIGKKDATSILIDGLAKLEYRGYDSAGIATLENGVVTVCKKQGKVAELQKICESTGATVGIGHTRWATHGVPSEENAHPHTYGKVTVVHNGIIENYKYLQESYLEDSKFVSATDTEVLAALIDKFLTETSDIKLACLMALNLVVGTFGLVVLNEVQPEIVIAARRGSPLLLGVGKEELFIASDATPLLEYTKDVIYLKDDQIAVCEGIEYEIFDLENEAQTAQITTLDHSVEVAQKDGYEHYLIKEIHEQPDVVAQTMRGRLQVEEADAKLGGLNLSDEKLKNLESLTIIGCGTSYFAGMVAQYQLEELLRIPVRVEMASEFRYRNPIITTENTAYLFMSQSGETADTLACLTLVKQHGAHTLGVVNVVGSTIAREVDGGMYIHAGPEISVASTKAYSAMVTALLLFGLHIATTKGVSKEIRSELAKGLSEMPAALKEALKEADAIEVIADKIKGYKDSFFLGRGSMYPAAMEGALKFKEVSYLHSDVYPTGEMKHGPLALVDDSFLNVVLLPQDQKLREKTVSNLQEIKARSGKLLIISDQESEPDADWHIKVPTVNQWIEPLVKNIPLQLLAYYVATKLGNNVDQPRNLAKSVTVE